MEVADRQTILAAGDMLGCYRIDSFLGQGGFGITYLAHDTMLDIQVAIKEYLPEKIAERVAGKKIQPQGSDNRQVFLRGLINFLKEARTLAQFKHPNIVRVMSVFELNGTAYMVMEYERGQELKLLFNRREHVSEKQLRAIIAPIIDGLDEVHRHGFIHRDIKPGNIVVRDNGSPVLIDFGSARLAVGRDTAALTALVTVGFAPLEQYSGLDEQQGPWTDIYALGAVLYYAVTGDAPLDSTLRGASLLNDKPDPLVSLTRLAPAGYSMAFCQAVDWALNFKVSDRPQALRQWRAKLFSELTESRESEDKDIADTVDLSGSRAITSESGFSEALGPGRSAPDAPTVLNTPPLEEKSQASVQDDAFELETANTVLIEDDQWDISDISSSQRQPKSQTRFFPVVFALSAAALFVFFKPWNILQTGPIEADSASNNTVDIAQTAISLSELNDAETNPSENSTSGESREISELPDNSNELPASSGPVSANSLVSVNDTVVSVKDSVPLADTDTDMPAQDQSDQNASVAEQAAARDIAQLELDRAVQRAEMRRMAELRARLEEQSRSLDQRELAFNRQASDQARLARQDASRKAAPAVDSRATKEPITNADMAVVLTRFDALSSAIANRDSDALRRITVQSDRNYAYFDYVFSTFDKIEVKVGNISANRQEQKIQATLVVSRIIRGNGDIAIPPEEFQNIPIFSVKEAQWSAIHW